MTNLFFYIELVIDKIYSFYFCLKCFPFMDALKIPVNISHTISIGNVYKGCIVFNEPIRPGMLLIGHQGFSAVAEQKGLVNIDEGCKLICKGSARLSQGIRLWIENNSDVELGDNFYCNKNCLIRANENICFGKDVLIGWDVEFNTTDGHDIYVDSEKKGNSARISIGNKVWIASHSIISKGAKLPDGSVVAQSSVVTRQFEQTDQLIGGIPAISIRNNISWKL